MNYLTLLPLLLFVACAATQPSETAVQQKLGWGVEKTQRAEGKGTVIRVAGAPWLLDGEATSHFNKEAETVAWKMGCLRFRVDKQQESIESTLLGTRKVIQGTVVCIN